MNKPDKHTCFSIYDKREKFKTHQFLLCFARISNTKFKSAVWWISAFFKHFLHFVPRFIGVCFASWFSQLYCILSQLSEKPNKGINSVSVFWQYRFAVNVKTMCQLHSMCIDYKPQNCPPKSVPNTHLQIYMYMIYVCCSMFIIIIDRHQPNY